MATRAARMMRAASSITSAVAATAGAKMNGYCGTDSCFSLTGRFISRALISALSAAALSAAVDADIESCSSSRECGLIAAAEANSMAMSSAGFLPIPANSCQFLPL